MDLLPAAALGVILWSLLREDLRADLSHIDGWQQVTIGTALIFFGTLISLARNFKSLDHFAIFGDIPVQVFLEKVVGYLLGYMVLAYGLMRWFPKLIEHHELMKKDLQRATTETKFLSGLLPICASCKKIRNDAGYWTQIEAYIRDHSEAEFSHGICPECSKNLYPEFEQ
jgi:hypothetical protein